MHTQALGPRLLVKANLPSRNPKPDVFSAHPHLLLRLKESGIYGAEVALGISGDWETDSLALQDLLAWATPWLDAGLRVYLHPYTDGPANPGSACKSTGIWYDAFRRVADLAADLARRQDDPVKLVYHAAGYRLKGIDEPLSRSELLRRSIRFFRYGSSYAAGLGGLVLLLTETQLPPSHSQVIRIGDRPEEILAIIAEAEGPTGICWDTGHYLKGVEYLNLPLAPPAKFVEKVGHMHIHDVVEGKDHRIVTQQSRAVASSVILAIARGNVTSITLEYDYRQAAHGKGDALDQVMKHICEAARLVAKWTATGAVQKAGA